ncbi:DnaD domain-containing protein [Ornithinibacillus bavariensis]|uniref:DNA replication protein DnaD n=1 Tax=Ornithinibacillus bavariensis TaxID=545502 RepID=A0A919X9Q5_9BACI|nr:DnaD domain-containing protein [Ornithinibacillus bavariensis]GIO28429.1 DNA replication protein DnaD [Ornithinibacillus bavariensis]
MTNSLPFQHILANQVVIPNLLLQKYNKLGLDEIELVLLIQIHRSISNGNYFPTLQELTSMLTTDEQTCSRLLRKLIQKGFLKIERQENSQEQWSEAYSLEPLWEKLFEPVKEERVQNEDGSLFILFEQEFGRPLSPFEIETVNLWLDEDKLSPALIKAALRESVLMGKLNFKYMDRILREWKKKGIHTVEQAREATKKFHDHQATKYTNTTTKKRDTSFYYNWLEGEE